ncbi:unnamed protein product [Rotaria socialis]|uniref:WSC domain-containing protein n=1 Tax=Rotaria socialis TaxID=392032 RepID=A0A821GI72_9BILA|nr:unnamed protein product [Rotaria socialis]CAF3513050.1 unnamed protein product [Rotaria socialis]CAF4285775.1 unnamed protein product [Rotaria socialis]CAF4666717.1 unnamed protein product [Rotaria socialis]
MEPTLCFRLCDTPVIYLQSTVCRCAGGGLMHYSRQNDDLCKIPCAKPVDRSVKSLNTCGGLSTYSAYVEDNFFTRHGHLFDYQIKFSACELWKISDIYDIEQITLPDVVARSSLNRLERCAAACLDKNVTTKSIGYNEDSSKCSCIMVLRNIRQFDRKNYIQSLPSTACDLYCNNTFEGSKISLKYQCGSLNNSRVWAIYDINGTCPVDFAYIPELKKCVSTKKFVYSACDPPAVSYVYDGTVTWDVFLKVIGKLELNSTTISMEFHEDVVVDRKWKCTSTLSTTTESDLELKSYLGSPSYSSSNYWGGTSRNNEYSYSNLNSWRRGSSSYGWQSTYRYILNKGCLLEVPSSSFVSRYSHRLCTTDSVNKYSSKNSEANKTYIASVNPQIKYCPTDWFDLNGRCYRISEETKTIEQARNSCASAVGGGELSNTATSDIVKYVSEWQARLGFFLLDTDPDSDDKDPDATTTMKSFYYDEAAKLTDSNDTSLPDHEAINEFQLIDASDNKTSNNTCMIISRVIAEEEERPSIISQLKKNCTKPRHVLCDTNTLVVEKFQVSCFSKPYVLDLPALVSKTQLTHELCLSVCQELQTRLAILHMDKCYCLNGITNGVLNITVDFEKFRQKSCGNPCPGNTNELCGDNGTIVVYQILNSRRTQATVRKPPEPFPLFAYDSCISLPSFDQSTVYQFKLTNKYDFHPRYCLELCAKYEQKYALINDNECLCTNRALKRADPDAEILTGQSCSQPCASNYFYTCGNKMNVTVYSMYVLQPKCRHGYLIAQNDEQCVFSHFSVKKNSLAEAKSYCEFIGGTLAKINDTVELQDILPESILYTILIQRFRLSYKFRLVNDTRYYWIDRTTDIADEKTISTRLLKQCSTIPENVNRNCIAVTSVPNNNDDEASDERCITESNECTKSSAMPVCVDKNLESKPTLIQPIKDGDQTSVTVDVITSYECDDPKNEYHLIDDYCYKVSDHKTSWKDAQEECRRDNAMVFIPEKSVSLQYVKTLFLRQQTYSSSDVIHVGVHYDMLNRTVIESDVKNNATVSIVPDSNAIYDMCEKTFHERYAALMSSTSLTTSEKKVFTTQQIGCGYMNFGLNSIPTVLCDEIPCNLTATVICQKLPTSIMSSNIKAKQEYVNLPPTESVTNIASTTLVINTEPYSPTDASQDGTTEKSIDDHSTNNETDNDNDNDSDNDTGSIGRDFAPLFLILTIAFLLILLGVISTVYNHRNTIFRHVPRRNPNSVYSQLTSANEFDLN